jgi:hypothetical protein
VWKAKPKNKYGAKRQCLDGYTFDSQMEARRYAQLKILVHAGAIQNLEIHPRYPIAINGKKICAVILDFQYTQAGKLIVEDVKGRDTPLSRLKRKLVEALHPITVTLIR